ncbi:Ni,Fe-hydrogenase III large subunit [Candidatus Magnetobacterium bavaricum]|uniref:Ni,Fe-hydrogenase III large subunit n=1 Tax=Candidatus Magnetobacterium bavaricum TaxID=29290 RepID=A0A0F3GRB6_9BACT|nr:Ni,Fe-hydrogenase III large subunit [Candidatus Magnetobacterium bavaricum]
MARWLLVKNAQAVPKADIPTVHMAELAETMLQLLGSGHRVVQFCGRGKVKDDSVVVTAVLADDSAARLLICRANPRVSYSYDAITTQVPGMSLFERELWEQTGIVPNGHPDLRPLRTTNPTMDATHDVDIGPFGVDTEPYGVRLQCLGQEVYHGDIDLGYQHRGVEALFRQGKAMNKAHLAESVAGDSAVAHAWAYSMAMESLSNSYVSMKAEIIRGVALELQRIAMHLSSLAGISASIGFSPGVSKYGELRSEVLDLLLMLCGNRHGRGLIRPGGVLFDVDEPLREHIMTAMEGLRRDTEAINAYLLDSPGVMSHLQGSAVIGTELAWKAGIVGVAAKASGLPIDCRADQPFGIYRKDKIVARLLTHGDTYARVKIRALEIDDSIALVRKWLSYGFMVGDIMAGQALPAADQVVVSMVEGWRGAVCHMVTTTANSELEHYKVVDASFFNCSAVPLAMRGASVTDLPLCSRGFDLSCCGVDL